MFRERVQVSIAVEGLAQGWLLQAVADFHAQLIAHVIDQLIAHVTGLLIDCQFCR